MRENPLIKCDCGCGQDLYKYRVRKKTYDSKKNGIIEYIYYIERNFINGHNKSMKGKHHTDFTKKIIGEAEKGLHRSIKTEFKKGQNLKEKNINWKGGITPINDLLRKSTEYKEWRLNVYKKDYYMCQICGSKGRDIIAHHKKSFVKYPKLRYDVNNGITLCRKCHLLLHQKLKRGKKCH